MQLWVGLGNPGKEYANTRHNAGEYAIRLMIEEHFKKMPDFKNDKKLKALSSKINDIHIILPQTYMNLSGDSVVKALNFYKIPLRDMVVFHDEIDLPENEIRYKYSGGHAGHNGLKDIIRKTGSNEFHRIRIGIGRPANSNINVADYVLSKSTLKPDIENIIGLLQKNDLL